MFPDKWGDGGWQGLISGFCCSIALWIFTWAMLTVTAFVDTSEARVAVKVAAGLTGSAGFGLGSFATSFTLVTVVNAVCVARRAIVERANRRLPFAQPLED